MRSRPGIRPRAALPAIALLALSACIGDVQPSIPPIPTLPAPEPVPRAVRTGVLETLRFTVGDARFVTEMGVRGDLPRSRGIVRLPSGPGGAALHLEALHLWEPDVVFPPDTVVTGLDLFIDLLPERLQIDRVTVENGRVGTLAHPTQFAGRWLWRMADVDLRVDDIRIGGNDGTPESVRLVRASGRGEVRGRPLVVTAGRGAVDRTDGRLVFEGAASFGTSRLRASGFAELDGPWSLEVVADTLRFPELRALVRSFPEEGGGEGRVRASGTNGLSRFTVEGFRAAVRGSRIALEGTFVDAAEPTIEDAALDLMPLRAGDVEAITGVALPGGGVWSGRIQADGGARGGIALSAGLQHRQDDGERSNVAVDGDIVLQPAVRMDVAVTGTPLRLADTSFTVALRARGPPDSVAIRGTASVAGPRPVSAVLDAVLTDATGERPRLAGSAVLRARAPVAAAERAAQPAPVEATARAEGGVVLARDGPISLTVRTEAFPIAFFPWPEPVTEVRGTVAGGLTVGGTIDRPLLDGRFRLNGGGFDVPEARLSVRGLRGPLRLDGETLWLDRVRGRANRGTLVVDGRVDLFGANRRVAVDIDADGVRYPDRRTGDVAATADLELRGPVDAPRLSGRVVARGRAEGAAGEEPQPVRATARGTAVLAPGGRVSVRITADTLPLAALPWPDGVRDVRGGVSGGADVRGTIDDPRIDGRFRVEDGAFRVPKLGLQVEEMAGPVRLVQDAVVVDGITARVGSGTAVVRGRVGLSDPYRLDLVADLDRVRAADTEDATVVASGRLRLAGPIERPELTGRIRLVDGSVREDVFRPDEPLDLSSPPYAALAKTVPWPDDSRLLRAPPPEPPTIRVDVLVAITPEFSVVDDDSDLFGTGTVRVRTVEDDDVDVEGDVRVLGGFYAFFGERFQVIGGSVRFPGDGIDARIGIIAEHEDVPLTPGGRLERRVERFPPLRFFAHGSAARPKEEIQRWSLFRETEAELAAYLIYDLEPMPVTGWRYRLFWRADGPGEVFGERAEAQGVPLFSSYVADEAYDYIPIRRVALRAGTIQIGPRYPARIVLGPAVGASVTLTEDVRVMVVSQPFDGRVPPGVRARYRFGRGFVEVFTEPEFFAAAPAGDRRPGFFERRRTGIGVGWAWEY